LLTKFCFELRPCAASKALTAAPTLLPRSASKKANEVETALYPLRVQILRDELCLHGVIKIAVPGTLHFDDDTRHWIVAVYADLRRFHLDVGTQAAGATSNRNLNA
jgi:hypothetical protein